MKFDKVLKEASLSAATVAGTDKPSSVDWVNSKGSKAKKGYIHMINPNALGQKPPGVKVRKAKKPFKDSK